MMNSYRVGEGDDRPWGRWEVLAVGEGYIIKHILVAPGQRLSLQYHHHRAEHWIVTRGVARITLGDEVLTLGRDGRAFVPAATPHRAENPGPEDLEFIEVQTGERFSEDDIVRLEDIYGRA